MLKDNPKKFINNINYQNEELWEFKIALRLYVLVFLMVYPNLFFIIYLKYLSALSIIILGFFTLLIVKHVFLTSQNNKVRYSRILFCIMIFININFISNLFLCFLNWNLTSIFLNLSFLIGSVIYFVIIRLYKPFRTINSFIIKKTNNWLKIKNNTYKSEKIFGRFLNLWIIFSIILITLPYPIYFQNSNFQINTKPHRDFGIWTYGQSLNEDKIGEPEYITNQTLKILGDKNVYFVYGLNLDKLDNQLIKNLVRCKDFEIEVHISVNPLKMRYTNIWSFESFREEIIEVLDYIKSHNLIGNPVTTFVYDMEVDPDAKYPFYNLDTELISKLNDYNEIETKFSRFNNHIKQEYDLKIRITTDISQGFDLKDGDNDLMTFSGLLNYEKADFAYMVYRRNSLGQNQILDHCRFLEEGDIIILNAWRDIGSLCWKNIECAIRDAFLVLGYPKKSYRLEIWALSYFLISFGENGLIALVDAINQDVFNWPGITVLNTFPYSFWWDLIFFGYIIIDLYGTIFRIIYLIF